MKKIALFLSFLGLLCWVSSCSTAKSSAKSKRTKSVISSSKIVFQENVKFEDMIAEAQELSKPIFIDFYTDWCAPCKWLEKDVFQTQEAALYFNENLVNIRLNAEKGEGVVLARQFSVAAYPTMVFLDPQGKELERHVGMTTVSTLVAKAKEAVRETQKQLQPATGKK